jgi:hypothetical protein
VQLLGKAVARNGDLFVSFEVTDGDGEQVLGRLSAGGAEVPILRSGRHTEIVLSGVPENAVLTVSLSDGQDRRDYTLK